jgi:hypothetical protein
MKNIHIPGLPHRVVSKETDSIVAQKIIKFCDMFNCHSEYSILFYGHNKSVTHAKEQINVTSDEVLFSTYGDHVSDDYTEDSLAYSVYKANTLRELLKRKQRGDIVLAFWPEIEQLVSEANKDGDLLIVEPSVSSSKAFAPFRCYESYTLKAAFVGTEAVSSEQPKWYWRVVPASFNVGEYSQQTREDWALYVSDGPFDNSTAMAIDACSIAGLKLKICGEGSPEQFKLSEWPSHVEYLGRISKKERLDLLGRAYCGFLLSCRWEPFGSSAIEMMLSGCVPITTDAGAMTEYIVDGLNGFRCNTMADILRGVKQVGKINRNNMASFARTNFSLHAVKPRFERAFADFSDVLFREGWFTQHDRQPAKGLGLDYNDLYNS